MSTQPIGRALHAEGVTKTQAAYSAIRTSIEAGVYVPGARLRLNELQQALGISITPIREALRMLQADGVVTGSPHRGLSVATHTAEEIDEVYQIREFIESLAAGYAAKRRTQEQIQVLRETYADLVDAAGDGNDAAAAALNASFHAYVVAASGSRLLEDVHERLRVVLPLNGLWLVSGHRQSNLEHRRVLDAIERGDSAAAEQAMRDHVMRGHRLSAERFGVVGHPAGSDVGGGDRQ